MKYLKYFENKLVDTDEIFEIFQDFIDEFSVIKWDNTSSNNIMYKTEETLRDYLIDIAYWTQTEDRRDKIVEKIYQYLTDNILSRIKSMGIDYKFSQYDPGGSEEYGYEATIRIPKN